MLLRVAFYGFVVVGVLPWLASSMLIVPRRAPSDAGPEPGFEELWLRSDGLHLRAWYLSSGAGAPPALLLHGVGDSIESQADSARRWAKRGHPVLLVDLRGHGRSQGRHTTLGGRERRDVEAGIEALRGRGLLAHGVLLSGVSMGAVAALHAAAGRDDVRAVIAESPFDSYRATVAHHAELYFRLPRWLPLLPMSIAIAEWRAGFDADSVDSLAAARRLRAPLLLIAGGDDRRMPEAVVRRVFDAHPGPKRLWVAPGAPHANASWSEGYWPTVESFLLENGLPATGSPAPRP